MAEFVNINPLIGRLVGSGLASLRELQTVYDLEDALALDEVLTLRNYHSWLATQQDQNHG